MIPWKLKMTVPHGSRAAMPVVLFRLNVKLIHIAWCCWVRPAWARARRLNYCASILERAIFPPATFFGRLGIAPIRSVVRQWLEHGIT